MVIDFEKSGIIDTDAIECVGRFFAPKMGFCVSIVLKSGSSNTLSFTTEAERDHAYNKIKEIMKSKNMDITE